MQLITRCVRLAVLCAFTIASLANAQSQEVLSNSNIPRDGLLSKLLVREKRHSLKFGRCDPVVTNLGQQPVELHEMPVRKEKFFIRPRSTFREMTLQLKLDNTFSRSKPRIYGNSIRFRDTDLKTLNKEGWIEVVAEISKYKHFGPDYWQMTLTVDNSWVRKEIIYKWWKIYIFDSMVISGNGGCEWTFDCYPDDTLPYAGDQEALELDITDDGWWLVGAVVGAIALLTVLVLSAVWCNRKKLPAEPMDYITKSISFRKTKKKTTTCDEIYEELGSASLNRLRHKLAGFGDEAPPPLPAPNLPREGGYTTVLPPIKKGVRDVQDQEWYGSLELHSNDQTTEGVQDNEKAHHSSTLPQVPSPRDVSRSDYSATEPRGTGENYYSNTPTPNTSTYVDMRQIRTTAPSQ